MGKGYAQREAPPTGIETGAAPPSIGSQSLTSQLAAAGTAPSAGGGPSLPAWSYVEQVRALVLDAIGERVERTGLMQPHARLRWADPKAACGKVMAAIRDYVDAAPGMALKRLMGLAFPEDLIAVVDRARNGQPGTRWLPEVGRALGEALDVPLVASVQRMGLRLRVQLDAGAMPRGASLVASCPLDGVIADVLVAPGVVIDQRGTGDTGDKPFARGAREVEYTWMGQRDPALWNWIHVTSPANATAEDVARTPLAGGEVTAGSEQAHRIAASPPYFAIPIETARLVKAATDHAPPEIKTRLAQGNLGPRVASGAALAGSAVSDEAALTQAAGSHAAPDERALAHAGMQYRFLMQRLTPWHAQAPLAALEAFLRRRAHDGATDKPRWAPVLAEVEHTLRAAADEVQQLLAAASAVKPDDAAAAPVREVVQAYARAAGMAHLAAQAPAALAEARRLRAMLPLALAEQRVQGARSAVADQQAVQRGAGRVEERSREPIAAVPDLATRAADLRLAAARGEGVDGDAADELAADADVVALRAEISTLQTELATVERLAADVTVDNGAGWTIPKVTHMLRGEAASWLAQLDRTRDLHRTEGANDRRARTAGARRTVDSVRTQKAALTRETELAAFLQYAYQRIADQQLRNALNRMALQIGLMIATGEIAGAAVAAVRGVALAREARLAGEVIADVRKLQLSYTLLETTSQAFLLTKATGATGGPSGAGAFTENLAGIALSSLAMKPFEALLGDARGVERELRTWLDHALAGAKATTRASLELGTGIAAAGAASTLVHGAAPHAAGADDVLTQAIALVASKLVHRHTAALRERITRAMSHVDRTKAEPLLLRAGELLGRAAASSAQDPTHIDPHESGRQLAESGELLQQAQLYQHAAGTSAESAGNAAARATRTSTLLEAPLRLAGLTPVVDGAIFEGTPAQISQALSDARRAGIPLDATRDATGTWHVTSGERRFALHELGGKPKSQHEAELPHAQEAEHGVTRPKDAPDAPRGRGLPEYPIAKSAIRFNVSKQSGGELECEYYARTTKGDERLLADVHMPLTDDGAPAGPPKQRSVCSREIYADGKAHVPRIYDQVIDTGGPVPRPSGELTSTTRYVLDAFGEFYQQRFGRPLEAWSGELAFSNRRNFQREYAKARLAGVPASELDVTAVKAISFGIHRVEAGFKKITVKTSGSEQVDLGDGLGMQTVPARIKVTARRR